MGAPYNYRILSLELFVEHLNKALQDKRIWQDLYDHKTPLVSINYYIYIYRRFIQIFELQILPPINDPLPQLALFVYFIYKVPNELKLLIIAWCYVVIQS